MKTFVLFMVLWLISILISFNIWKNSCTEEMLKMVLATQIAFIIYSLLKEEDNVRHK
jgi:uncharacterized membrane protein